MMKPITIKEMYDAHYDANPETPFLSPTTTLANLPFMAEYIESPMFNSVDRIIARERGIFYPVYNSADIGSDDPLEVLKEFQRDVYAMLVMKSDNYQHLFDLKNIEYVPIENYSMIEKMEEVVDDETNIDITHGTQISTDVLGTVVDTLVKGSETDTTVYGEVNETDNTGVIDETETIGAVRHEDTIGSRIDHSEVKSGARIDALTENVGKRIDDTENSVAGYNDSAMAKSTEQKFTQGVQENITTTDKGKQTDITDLTQGRQENIHSEDERINNKLIASRIDTKTIGSRTDATNKAGYQDVNTIDSRTDTSEITKEPDKTVNKSDRIRTYELTRSGNIGVTTSQQMAESEIKLWTSFEFYNVIIEDIIKSLCRFYDAGYEPMLTPMFNDLLRMRGEV